MVISAATEFFLWFEKSLRRVGVVACAVGVALCGAGAAAQSDYDQTIPAAVRGPFISHPGVVNELDCPSGQCGGPLDFSRLIQARARTSFMKDKFGGNPFKLKIAAQISHYIEQDLDQLAIDHDVAGHQIDKRFLTDEDSRLELVGIINRMDRQFIKDTSQGLTPQQLACGEISLIYRFGYSLRDRDQKSRLPVTLNMVFPALPSDTKGGSLTCKAVAQRWLDAIPSLYKIDDASQAADVKKVVAALMDLKSGPLALIDGRDMIRLELNIQAYRKPAGIVKDFGTEAAYILRVFKWLPNRGYFDADILRNQIDRGRVLCLLAEPDNCAANEVRRKRLVAFLSRPDTLQSIDWGTLEIDYGLDVLAKRGTSISPGGSHRSNNQVYWNAKMPGEQIISDDEIEQALRFAKSRNIKFSFIRSVDDFRTRLNESACTGCHQTRAIAGFHFPGADRKGTSPVNSVLLPGSPQFYGDQPRRLEILKKIASGRETVQFDLATSYAARPMNRFRDALGGTQLIGGWGGACLVDEIREGSQRQWTCQPNHDCVRLFNSKNDNGVGTCIPARDTADTEPPKTLARQIGDALQQGDVTSALFGKDSYARTFPGMTHGDDTVIPPSALPLNPPGNNSYYGAHQEYHDGHVDWTKKDILRDAQTGGFPSGMLRLSECLDLPGEATCGLIASTGFNDCVAKLGTDDEVDHQRYTIDTCFKHFTSYAGLRACSAGSPCRDDYICVKPMEYEPLTVKEAFEKRKRTLLASKFFPAINDGHIYRPEDYYGQLMPDQNWISRKDRRGLCIPPYFVFQFRADGHPGPGIRKASSP